MELKNYTVGDYSPGAPFIVQLLWYFLGAPLVHSRILASSTIKVLILKLFGARIGKGVVVKCGVNIKHPWRISIGDHSWIGENVWIDNIGPVKIGSNCCISQGVYLCSGDHDFKSKFFDLRLRAIDIGNKVWLAAQARIAPGTTIEEGVVVTFGSVACRHLKRWGIFAGNPATWQKERVIPPQEQQLLAQSKEILIINQSFYPDITATAQHLSELSADLVKRGHSVTVLCSHRSYGNKGLIYPSSDTYQGVKIIRVKDFIIPGASRLVRTINAGLMNLSFLLRLAQLRRFDSVIVMTSPPLVAWIARMFAKKPRRNFIYWIMDLNPDQAIAAGWLRKDSILAKCLNACLRSILDYSDHIIVLDQKMKSRISNRVTNTDKISILPLWIDCNKVAPVAHDTNPFRKECGLDDKFVVMYSGNLSLCHPISTLLHSAEKMKDDPSTVFLVVGGGHGMSEALAFKTEKRLENLVCLPYQEIDKLSFSLSAADLHIVSLGSDFDGIVHPSKIYGILGVERPFVLIGPESSYVNEQFVTLGLGKRVDHSDTESLIEAINSYKSAKPGDYNQMKLTRSHALEGLRSASIFDRFETYL